MLEKLAGLVTSPLFGIVLSIACFEAGQFINRKLRSPLANPLLIAIILVIAILKLARIPFDDYNAGGSVIAMFLAPATAALALPIYYQLPTLKKNLLPILAGTAVGSAVSMGSVYLLCSLFRLDEKWTMTLLPKSVTTPFAMEISRQLGGVPSVTVAAVILTGIMGAILAPLLIKLFRIKNPVEAGLAIGASSHAVGTSKALEIGETEGAMSGLAIGVAGIMTVVFATMIG